jgi:hypothetical protein
VTGLVIQPPKKPRKRKITKKQGRPPGAVSRIQEFKDRLVATNGSKIIDKIIKIALNAPDEHGKKEYDSKDELAALKMCIDRVLPISTFEKVRDSKPQITVQILSSNGPSDVSIPELEYEDIEEVEEDVPLLEVVEPEDE